LGTNIITIKFNNDKAEIIKTVGISIGGLIGTYLMFERIHNVYRKLQSGTYIHFVGSNNLHIVFKFDENSGTLQNFYYEYNKRRVFASKKAQQEYHFVNEEPTSKSPAPKKPAQTDSKDNNENKGGFFTNIKGWFSKDSSEVTEAPKLEQPVPKKPAQTESEDNGKEEGGIFTNIKRWFKK